MSQNNKKDAFFFKHDSNAQDDPKIMLLIEQMQMEGVGIFWCLVEKLRSEKDYKLPFSVIPSFARRWGTSKEKVLAVINGYGLFITLNDYFFSVRLTESMNYKNKIAVENANKRWKKDATAMQLHSNRNATGMLEDKIREDNTLIGNNTRTNTREDKVILDIGLLEQTFIDLETRNEKTFTEEQKEQLMHLIPEMVKIYMAKNPKYTFDKFTDYPACLRIAHYIAKSEGLAKSKITGLAESQIVTEAWAKYVDFILSEKWFREKPLHFLASPHNWQSVLGKMNTPKTETPMSDYERERQERINSYKGRTFEV